MRVKIKFNDYEEKIKELEEEKKELLKEFEEAKNNTNKFLRECEKYGIKTVSIATRTKKIKATKIWNYCNDMIFADEKYNGWPAIWRVAEMDDGKYNGGCGNSGQHQFNCARFIEGVYEFKEGKWFLLEDERNNYE